LPYNFCDDPVRGAHTAIAVLIAIMHKMKSDDGQFTNISMRDGMYYNNYQAMMDKDKVVV